MDTDLLGDGFVGVVSVIDELTLHACVEFLVSGLVVASLDLARGREQTCFAVSLSEDVFAFDAWHVACIALKS